MKHIRHSKTIGAVVLGAALLAVASVGFSAWVIGNGSATSDANSLGVEVAGVTDNYVAFETAPAWDDTAANICAAGNSSNVSSKMLVDSTSNPSTAYVVFGPHSSDTSGPIQASGYGLNDLEHLFVKFDFQVSWPADKGLDISISSANTTSGNARSKLATAESGGYIVNPDGVTSGSKALLTNYTSAINPTADTPATGWTIGAASSPTENLGRKTQTFAITMTWAWGTQFGGQNPSKATESNAGDYLLKLKTMIGNTVLGGLSGGLDMTVTAAIHS